jgi:hypothetical protein
MRGVRERTERDGGAAPAVTTRNRDPGRPWIRPPGVRQTPRLALHPSRPAQAARSGPKGSGAPGSRREPRRRRSGAPYGEAALGSGRGRSPCLIRTVSTPAPYGAPLPLLRREPTKSRTELARRNPRRGWRSMPRRSGDRFAVRACDQRKDGAHVRAGCLTIGSGKSAPAASARHDSFPLPLWERVDRAEQSDARAG